MTIIRINHIAGVPILYDRDPPSNYGVSGYPIRPYIDEDFAAQVETVFTDLFVSLAASGVGEVKCILTGGISRTGTGPSYHHRKRAFDLDGLVFADNHTWVANDFLSQRFEYLLIEAHLRRVFGTVLNFEYDVRHQDHIHFDNGDAVGFKPHSKSRALFLQNSLRYLFDQMLGVDGVYGPETKQTELLARGDLQIGGLSKKSNWLAYLTACIEMAEERLSAPAIVEAFA